MEHELEPHLSQFLQDLGESLIKVIGAPVAEVDAMVAYVRAATDEGRMIGDAMVDMWRLRTEGQFKGEK